MVLERLIQAQTKCHRIVLFVGDENPMVAYHFDLVGSFPYTEGKDLDEFYEDVVLRMVTTASTRELKDHEVEKTMVSSSVWEGLPTPAAMCDASRELGKRGFFTEPAHLERYVEIPDFFPLDSMMSRQYSEGCFGAWDVKLEALIATVTGSAVPVHKGNITEEDLAIISGIKEDRSGAVIRHRQGVPNHPPSVEAVELMMMDRTLPQVIPSETSSSKAPVVRAKLHGHRGIASYDPRYVEFVPVDGPYYDYIVTCATEAQAWAVEGAFAKSEALQNPDDPRKVVFTILPGHGNVIVEKWASGTRPFQTILDYMDKGYVTVESYVPQGRVEYLSAADGKKIVHIVEEDPETIVNRYRDPSRKAQVS